MYKFIDCEGVVHASVSDDPLVWLHCEKSSQCTRTDWKLNKPVDAKSLVTCISCLGYVP